MALVSLTKAQIADSPSAKTDEPVSLQFEEKYHAYFGWPYYWIGSSTWGNSPMIPVEHPVPRKENADGKKWDHHLRSTIAIKGYGIHASDGDIGHVDSFVMEVETWTIRYLVVSINSLLQWKKVLISPQWIESVSWEDSKVFVNLLRETIKQSPAFSKDTILDRNYEEALHRHYKLKGHWVT